jgi:diphthamide biosynthesis methyltransferase
MLYVIGLGLSDEKDITVKGLEAVKRCERVYLESYTSILMISKEKLVGNLTCSRKTLMGRKHSMGEKSLLLLGRWLSWSRMRWLGTLTRLTSHSWLLEIP